MQIKILFNEDSLDKKLHIGWGVSFLIDDRILFDTGENGQWLIENINNLGIDVAEIEAAVISHDHWDHSGGLPAILQANKGLKVYGCKNFSADLKKKITSGNGVFVALDDVSEILPGIYSTGAIAGAYAGRRITEQALVIKTSKGISVLTGCAHPGIIKMLGVVRRIFPAGKPGHNFYLVAGGFHLMEEDKRVTAIIAKRFQEMKIKKVGPTHCSGKITEEIFKEKYGNHFIEIKAGQTLNI